MEKDINWWSEEYGFFGEHYLEGDNSKEGYLIEKKQNLKERTETEVSGIINLLNLKGGEKILDIPSGYGRHSIGLAKRGFNVTGSELNSIHLNKAIENAKIENIEVRFNQENMIDIKYENEFDAVINMFYSFGFFDKDDVNIPRIISGKYREDETRNLENGKTLRIIDIYNPEDKKIHGTWIIKDQDGNEQKKDYRVRVYEKEEFINICKEIGFQKFEVYSDWNKTEYSEDSEDMIIIAEK